MATQYTSFLGLALPVTGELSGSWGDVVNTSITSLLDSAISGTTSLTTDADVTLTTTTGAANQARQAIILWNPASGTVTRNITAPAQSKIYTVINASGGTQSIVIRGAGPTTGVTIIKGESAQVAWNGSDFVKISSSAGDVTVRNLTVTGDTILGDASTDTVTVNGYVGVGGAGLSSVGLIVQSSSLTGVTQQGIYSAVTGNSSATTGVYAFSSLPRTAASAFTSATVAGFYAFNASKGAGSTITNQHGLYIADQTQGTNNYGVFSAVSASTNKWNIYAGGTAQNYFAGSVGIGTTTPALPLHVVGSAPVRFDKSNSVAEPNIRLATATDSYATQWAIGQASGSVDFGFSYFNGSVWTARMRIDSSGNLGLGVTPSAWGALKAVQLPAGAIAGFAGGTNNNQFSFLNNAYFDGTDYDYIVTDTAQMYRTIGGTYQWHNAPSGTAGTAITFSERMRLSAAGGLSIGTTTDPGAGGLITTGNTTLGDATTDTVTVNGYMGVGTGPNSTIALYARGTALSGTTQTGVYSYPTGTSAATANVRAFSAQPATDASAFTVVNAVGFLANDPVKGAGSTITNSHGVYIADQTQGTNNYGITSLVSSGSNKWNIYASGTAQNYFAGNVGIGTTTPANQLTVSSAASVIIQALGTNAANPSVFRAQNSDGVTFDFRMNGSSAATNASTALITTSGTQPIAFIQSGVESMRITGSGNNVGIGTSSPSSRLDVADATSAIITLTRTDSTSGNGVIRSVGNTGVTNASINFGGGVNNNMVFTTNAAERMRLDSSGNLGLGVTPSAWGASNKAIQLSGGAVWAFSTTQISLGQNVYDTGSGTFVYASTDAASRYRQLAGAHAWFTAPSGTAGNAITFTQAMTLFASGGLSVGSTTDPGAGNIRFESQKWTGIDNNARYVADDAVVGGALYTGGGFRFFTGGANERMRIDSSGNIIRGGSAGVTSSGGSVLGIETLGGTTAASSIGQYAFATTNAAPFLEMGFSRNATVGSQTVVNSGDVVGAIRFSGSDGTNFVRAAQIVGVVDGTPGTNDMPGRLVFSTSADGSVSPAERMRIDSAGNIQTTTGSQVVWAPAPASISTTATLTNANIQGQIINTTGTSYTVTMPLGSTLETLVSWATTDLGYNFTVINTASGTITMAVNTGVTSLGALTIATGTSAQFRIRRTAANTFILYRMS